MDGGCRWKDTNFSNGIFICKEMSLSYMEMNYSYTKMRFQKWFIHIHGGYRWKEMSCSNGKLICKEISFSYTRKWVIHTRKRGLRNDLFIYMGVIDERKWVVQMGYSYARKLGFSYTSYTYKETGFFIQENELFIRVIHTRKLVIHLQRNELFIHKWLSQKSYSEKGMTYSCKEISDSYQEMSFSYKEINYSYKEERYSYNGISYSYTGSELFIHENHSYLYE